MSTGGFDEQFASVAAKVNTSAPSTTSWRGVQNLLAEELDLDLSEIYVATISKPGNASVRFGQSAAANAASVLVAMHTGRLEEIEKTVEAMRRIVTPRNAAAIVAVREARAWTIVAIVERPHNGKVIGLLDEFPDAVGLPLLY